MGLFEEYPWLLVPLIIVTVEGWLGLKGLIKEALRRRRA
jgi:hypothetical protein